MAPARSRSSGRQKEYKYDPLTDDEMIAVRPRKSSRAVPLTIMILVSLALSALFYTIAKPHQPSTDKSCDTPDHGYECSPKISQFWGQYSLYYSVPSEIKDEVPEGCSITFANILSRHGSRDPSASKSEKYEDTISNIKTNVKEFKGKYSFLADYEYSLGADLLTDLGRQQLVNSGIKFYKRYEKLAKKNTPFVRTAGQTRVVESAEKWVQGYASEDAKHPAPEISVIISEDDGVNNTLSHSLCTDFEEGDASRVGDNTKYIWANVFITPIQARLNADLPNANLTLQDTINLMEMCPFVTVADPSGKISDFCSLFTEKEFQQYDYYGSLDKWYGYGNGNPLGATQGVGFANELIARLTRTPVVDHTSTNSTLDSSNATFPLDRALYADFSHDNDLAAVFAALGLFNSTHNLSNNTLETAEQTNGYSASRTVPFAARAYFEKMQCRGHDEDYVRIVINDRVMPLEMCGGDEFGRCTLRDFVESLTFVRQGGRWEECFTNSTI